MIRTGIIVILGILLLAIIDRTLIRQVNENYHQQTSSASSSIAQNIKSFADQRFSVLIALRNYFEVNPNVTQSQFDRFSDRLLRDTSEIRSLQWVNTDWVVTWVEPIKGNEQAIGHDLKTTPEAAPFVAKAIEEKRMTVNDPYLLRQGGLGVIARVPIFREGRFAGLNVAVLDVPAILRHAIRPGLTKRYHVRLRDAEGKVFWESEKAADFSSDTMTRKIIIGDNYWNVDVHLKHSARFPIAPIRGGLWLLGIFGLVSLTYWARNRELESIELEKKVKERTRRLHSINTVSLALTATQDIKVMMDGALTKVLDEMRAKAGAILLVSPESQSLHLLSGIGCGEELTEEIREIRIGDGPIGESALDGRPYSTTLGEGARTRSVQAWPLRSRDSVVGVILLIDDASRELPAEDEDLMETFSAQIGLALANAYYSESQREIAAALQEGLLPHLPAIPGIEVGSVYASATPMAAVGGDFYDLFTLQDNRLGVVIGDVSGKGVEAATATAQIRNSLRLLAFENLEAADTVSKLNEQVCRHSMRKGGFITFFFGILDPERGEFSYVCAGHPCPALLKQNGDLHYFACDASLALGISPHAQYQADKINIEVGDTVVLYTDGVLEAQRDSELFGEERLGESIVANKDLPVEELPKAIYDSCAEYSSGRLIDDVAIMAITRT